MKLEAHSQTGLLSNLSLGDFKSILRQAFSLLSHASLSETNG